MFTLDRCVKTMWMENKCVNAEQKNGVEKNSTQNKTETWRKSVEMVKILQNVFKTCNSKSSFCCKKRRLGRTIYICIFFSITVHDKEILVKFFGKGKNGGA